MAEEGLLERRLLALGLRGFSRVVTTQNRTVMVSVGRGRVLRIHRGYGLAPDRVLAAVVRFVTPGTRREVRIAAQREIVGFRAASPESAAPRRPRAPARPRPGDEARVHRLTGLFREYNVRHFGGALPALPIRLSGRMRRRLGHLALRHGTHEPYEITIGRGHLQRDGWEEAAQTLLHEMVHLWQHRTGLRVDHGPAFRRKAREVGIAPAAARDVGPGARTDRAARSR
jgi:hypothetical protein